MPVDITIEPGVALNSIDDDDKLPYNHVISVVDREISIDVPELVQNNVATDTYTLDLDGEWDGISPVVIFGPCESAVEVAYTNGPTTIPADVTKAYGPVDVSVVGYDSTGTVRIVTIAAPKAMNVLESGCYTGTTTEDPDPSLIGQLVAAGDAANKAAEAANTAADNANEKAQLAVEKADASAANADEKATLATDAAGAANTAANEARQVIAQLPLPDGNVPKRTLGPGAVLTTDDAFSSVPLNMKVYGNTRQNLLVNPSGTQNGVTVTANDDGSITLDGTSTSSGATYFNSKRTYNIKPNTQYTLSVHEATVGYNLAIRCDDAEGSNLQTSQVNATTTSLTFTTPEGVASALFFISVPAGQTVSGTCRVMLNEGDTAEPWCPPGLNSVSELECVFEDDGEQPNVTTIPIDLQGNELCSLPDGTRDVLDVVSGELRSDVTTLTVDTTGVEIYDTADGKVRYAFQEHTGTFISGYTYQYGFCDFVSDFHAESSTAASRPNSYYYTNNGYPVIVVREGTTLPSKITFVGKRKTGQKTIQLTPPELPALPSPNVTAYASANVKAESEMEYIRDVNVVLGKLESAAQAL